ncbi:MAG: KH domain-containing protein [Clostridia bacterium]|nr:KH domain-containing protein [Clostridia bacterium]
MSTTIISEGKTTQEAIEKGLKELKTTKEHVNIKVLENEEKKSFFSILAPRIVKVEITLKEENKQHKKELKREIIVNEEDLKKAEENVKQFLEELSKKLLEDIKYEVKSESNVVEITMNGENTGFLIGYRGETLYALQTILSSVANKGIENRVIIRLDIENYKAKREKTLQDLAIKTSKTVMRTGKSITLEPMQAYERKIIHSALQNNKRISTDSVGEEPRRRIVISLIKNKNN